MGMMKVAGLSHHPGGTGTVECSHWPKFKVYNRQQREDDQQPHGLDDLPPADATIVGLYNSD
jgi:hypothetical protein